MKNNNLAAASKFKVVILDREIVGCHAYCSSVELIQIVGLQNSNE